VLCRGRIDQESSGGGQVPDERDGREGCEHGNDPANVRVSGPVGPGRDGDSNHAPPNELSYQGVDGGVIGVMRRGVRGDAQFRPAGSHQNGGG
jgi:hypothetical protein